MSTPKWEKAAKQARLSRDYLVACQEAGTAASSLTLQQEVCRPQKKPHVAANVPNCAWGGRGMLCLPRLRRSRPQWLMLLRLRRRRLGLCLSDSSAKRVDSLLGAHQRLSYVGWAMCLSTLSHTGWLAKVSDLVSNAIAVANAVIQDGDEESVKACLLLFGALGLPLRKDVARYVKEHRQQHRNGADAAAASGAGGAGAGAEPAAASGQAGAAAGDGVAGLLAFYNVSFDNVAVLARLLGARPAMKRAAARLHQFLVKLADAFLVKVRTYGSVPTVASFV